MKENKRRILLWECAVGPCARVEKTATGTIVISDTKTKKEIEFTKKEFEALKRAIRNGDL